MVSQVNHDRPRKGLESYCPQNHAIFLSSPTTNHKKSGNLSLRRSPNWVRSAKTPRCRPRASRSAAAQPGTVHSPAPPKKITKNQVICHRCGSLFWLRSAKDGSYPPRPETKMPKNRESVPSPSFPTALPRPAYPLFKRRRLPFFEIVGQRGDHRHPLPIGRPGKSNAVRMQKITVRLRNGLCP